MVNATASRVFWGVTFDRYAWQFLNASRRRARYFRVLHRLPAWSASELRELIGRRNLRSGVELSFANGVADLLGSDDDFRLVEGGDGYFQLLADLSGGNPKIAQYLWLRSLSALDEEGKQLCVHLPPKERLRSEGLTDVMVHMLASICQHGSLSKASICQALNLRADAALFGLQYLRELGLLEAHDGDLQRWSLAPRFQRDVITFLQGKHLLLAGE